MDKIKLFMLPHPAQVDKNNGVGQVIHALFEHLPAVGIEFVATPEEADIVACHIHKQGLDKIDVLHSHGLEWTGDAGNYGYSEGHHATNRLIAEAARGAMAITVPSLWVASAFERDMHVQPLVFGHGLCRDQWQPLPIEKRGNYILWNKNRWDNVCDPRPAIELARRGLPVTSTFGDPEVMRVTGLLPHDKMRELVRSAKIYLATTKETFGIGTLEALAAGVPVLGYDFGGTSDIVKHQVNGYLVAPGDFDGLVKGYNWLLENYAEVSRQAAEAVDYHHNWNDIACRYVDLYRRVLENKKAKSAVGVVVTTHNYGQYVGQALDSLFAQTRKPDYVIVVDDASTDGTHVTLEKYVETGDHRFTYYRNETNKGVAASRNFGIEQVNRILCTYAGTYPRDSQDVYIICLDADDTLNPTYVQECAALLDAQHDVGIAYTGINQMFPDGTNGYSPTWPPPEVAFEKVAIADQVPPANGVPSAAMFRLSAWERSGSGYVQDHAPGEDAEFWLKILASGYRAVRATSMPLFNYRLHAGSASRTKQYKPITQLHPYATDKLFPFAAPISDSQPQPPVRSYSEPLVSVVIPVGSSHVEYMPTALDSLLGQTFRNWEAIVVDDTNNQKASSDLWQVYKRYPFVKLISENPKRRPDGAGAARNDGLAAAASTSKFVLWLDADDWLSPTALADMLKAYKDSGNASYVYSDWWLVTKGQEPQFMNCSDYNAAAWLVKPQHAVTALIDIEVARKLPFDGQVKSWEDWFYFAEFAVHGYCGVRVPKPLLYYRHHTGTRREIALANAGELMEIFSERFADYKEGRKEMAGCCGGRAPVISTVSVQLTEAERAMLNQKAKQNGLVPMIYVGTNTAPYRDIVNGRTYRGANNDTDKFADAPKEDVNYLIQTERWAIVEDFEGQPNNANV